MSVTVLDLMRETRNFFPVAATDAAWVVENSRLVPADGFHLGDWVAVTGSVYNNGVFLLGEGGALPAGVDEHWEGRVWLLAPPADFLSLAAEIAAWADRLGQPTAVKESFGAYSREIPTDSAGRPITWQQYFARQLQPWRRMYTEVTL